MNRVETDKQIKGIGLPRNKTEPRNSLVYVKTCYMIEKYCEFLGKRFNNQRWDNKYTIEW